MTWVPGEALLKRVWESIEKLGTGMLSPAQIRREGRAKADVRRHEMLNEATAQMDVAEILAGRARLGDRGEMVRIASADTRAPLLLEHDSATQEPSKPMPLPSPATEHAPTDKVRTESLLVIEQARAARDSRAINHLVNLRATVRLIEEELASTPEADAADGNKASEIDPDWLEDWREGASRTSSDQMRRLWAKLLIGETKSSGSFSLRTLAFLRTLDPADASLIAKAAPFVVDGSHIYRDESQNYGIGMDFLELLSLEDLGFLTGVSGGLELTTTLQADSPLVVRMHRNVGILAVSKDGAVIKSQIFSLTKIGREIVKLGDFVTPSSYQYFVGRKFTAHGVETKIVTYADLPNARVRVLTQMPVSPTPEATAQA